MVLQPVDEGDPEVVPLLWGAGVLLVTADIPGVPLARERERLSLRQ